MVKNVLFSDANHGGLVLLEEYYRYTSNNLFFYDVYDKLSCDEREVLSDRFNVTFLSLDEITSCEDDFVKVNPVHMPPLFGTDFTHHEFVSYLLGKKGFNVPIIQVTGVKGKSSVVSMIRSVLSDFNVLALSSDGLTFNDAVLASGMSIAPASIIRAVNLADDMGLLDKLDFCVFEVSLGTVNDGFVSVLTNVIEDYPIGGGAGCASRAKESVFRSQHVLCDLSSFREYYSGYDDVVKVDLFDSGADIFASDLEFGVENTSFMLHHNGVEHRVNCFALTDFYVNNMLFAVGVALTVGMDTGSIIQRLSDTSVLKGRGSYRFVGENLVIEDINPGLNTSSIKKCIDNVKRYDEEYILIIGGDYGITCEEIDENMLTDYLGSLKEDNIIFCGELGQSIKDKLESDNLFFKKLSDATSYCNAHYVKKAIQIIYRSEYDKKMNYLTK